MTNTPPRGMPKPDTPAPFGDGEGRARGTQGGEAAAADFFRLLVESVQDYAIFALDPAGRVLTWSAGAARLKGYARTEIVGRHFSTFYSPEDVAAGKPERELEIATRVGHLEDEGWRVRKDGSRFWANVVITALRDELGVLVGFAKVTRDLSERRAAEEQARRLAAETAARAEAERRSEELLQLNEQLQNQAMELEQQMEEAQSLAEELESANESLASSDAAARQALARFQGVFNSRVIGMTVFDAAAGRTLAINDYLLDLLGYAHEDIERGALEWRDVTPPEYHEAEERSLRQLVERGKGEPFEKEYIRKDGTRVPVSVSGAALPGSAGQYVVFVEDITERRRARAEAETAQARLTHVFQQAPVAVAVLRGRMARDLVYELVNPRYVEMLPRGRRPPVGQRLRDVLPEMDDALLAVLQRVLDTGEPFVTTDHPASLDRDNNGIPETYYFNFVYHPLVEADGAVAGVVGIGTEVTESVRARREIEAVYDSAPVGLCVLDVDLRYLRINERMAEINGVPAAAHLGRTVSEIVPGIADAATELLRRVLETGQPALDVEISGETPARPGVTRTWVEQWLPIRDAVGGTVVGINVVAQEVTEQRQAAAERDRLLEAERAARAEAERARTDAEAASRAKSDFLATMSHELRTPLNAIGGYAQLLEMGLRGAVTAEQRADLERIQRSQRHLLSVINEVLNYARLESGAVTYDIQPTLVAEVVPAVASLIEPQRAAKRLALDVRLPEFAGRPPLHVLADRDKLQQVLLNLLSNAIKFTPDQGRVTVELLGEPDPRGMAMLRVSDTGVGIPSDKLEAIFEPFVQVGRTLSSPGEGTGLGLAISRDLARGMGGDLTAESTPGVGSTFTLTLPRAVRGSNGASGAS